MKFVDCGAELYVNGVELGVQEARNTQEFQPLLPMCKEASLGLGESALREYVDTVLELRDPRRIPSSLEGVAVKLASVSAVAPEQLIEKLAAHHYIWK